jgi:shikimate kinase
MAFLQTLSCKVYNAVAGFRLQQDSIQRFYTARRKTISAKPVQLGLSSSSCAALTALTQSSSQTSSAQLMDMVETTMVAAKETANSLLY